MKLGRRDRRSTRSAASEPAPVVGELFEAAQLEAIAFRHDMIGTEHVLLALLGRDDAAGRALRGLGLTVAGMRADTGRIVGEGPAPEAVFNADALVAIGIDLEAVRQSAETTFGEGALERASRRRGSCAGAAFGVTPRLKQALESARQDAALRGTPLATRDVALGLAQQRESVAARILDAHGISLERLVAALDRCR